MNTYDTAASRNIVTATERYTSIAAITGRLLLSPIFVLSGIGKITGFEGYLAYISASGLPFPLIALLGAIALEICGGLALVVGYRARIASFLLAVFSLLTAVVFHSDFADQNQFLHFWKNLAIAGGLLQIAAFGPGGFSVDVLRSR
ncbi:DoxX family protein [Pararhizobium arenae]|uniref:DoxX family protein n=1 Tax=Pararhizobium arenae TaxID=1856850 RepID=UPI00094AB191|nr:DoxX family protein [Pararhizobium arenae]